MRVFFQEKNIAGSTMGSRAELGQLIEFLDVTGARPLIDQVTPMDQAAAALGRVASGDVFGKIVLTL
jgi:D-arabinose 1-dehydrogenase-like Zn-dependent alcohol dehydrogenase